MKKNEVGSVGVKEIARRANVSIGTVDRVLNNRAGVSQQTKERILAIIKEVDYQPNLMARRLASKKIVRLAVLIPAVSKETGYWAAPLEGIDVSAKELEAFGIQVERFLFDLESKESFIRQANKISRQNFDGLIVAPMFEEETSVFLAECDQKRLPYVLINSDLEDTRRIGYIGPDLYQSGYLAGHLSRYLVTESASVLVVNISKELDPHHHLLRKEEGFRAYFEHAGFSLNIHKIDVRKTDKSSINGALRNALRTYEPSLVFVTNSRVSAVAHFLAGQAGEKLKVIGYDYLPENISCLEAGYIDFLICQKPKEQGYRALSTLYKYLVAGKAPVKTEYMPIDIVTKENYRYYHN